MSVTLDSQHSTQLPDLGFDMLVPKSCVLFISFLVLQNKQLNVLCNRGTSFFMCEDIGRDGVMGRDVVMVMASFSSDFRGCRNGSMAKNTCLSSRGPE